MAEQPTVPYEDVRLDLPERAQKLLDAAHRLLIQEGYEGLSWSRIAKEADELKSTIGYYFGDKSNLVLTLLRLIGQNAQESLVAQCESLPEDSARIETFVTGLRAMHERPDSLAFFDVLPHAIRDERMRREVAVIYDWYHQMNLRVLGVPSGDDVHGASPSPAADLGGSSPDGGTRAPDVRQDARLHAAAWLFIAAIDGIMIQEALRPPGYDSDAVYEGLIEAIRHLVKQCEAE